MKEKLIPAVSEEITCRFQSFEAEIFRSCSIADYIQWDPSNCLYGTEVRNIAAHFKEPLSYYGFSLDLALKEWGPPKKLVNAKFAHCSDKIAMWQRFYNHYNQEFPHILLLMEFILIVPISSATVERGFSVMGRLLSNTRT